MDCNGTCLLSELIMYDLQPIRVHNGIRVSRSYYVANRSLKPCLSRSRASWALLHNHSISVSFRDLCCVVAATVIHHYQFIAAKELIPQTDQASFYHNSLIVCRDYDGYLHEQLSGLPRVLCFLFFCNNLCTILRVYNATPTIEVHP